MTWNVWNILTFGADGRVWPSLEEYARLTFPLQRSPDPAQAR
jgi:hypothetical protein